MARDMKPLEKWTFDELKAECSEMIVNAIMTTGLRGIGPQWHIIFHIYERWRKAQPD